MTKPSAAHAGGPASHLAALDGIRGLAIIMVLFVHFIGDEIPRTGLERVAVKLANYGIWGVDLFFVLSGFLITGILFDAKAKPHYFRNFYVRRTLRIFPLYYGVLVLLFGVLPLFAAYPAGLAEAGRHEAWLWTYTSNVYLARAGDWALPYVSHFWSLAVEEHFYLLWPIVVLVFARKTLLRVCVGVSVFALGLRIALSFAGVGDVALVVLTPCRLDALCIGAFLALASREVGIGEVARATKPWLVALPLLVLIASAWHAVTHGSLHDVVLPVRGTLVALSFGALLVKAVVTPPTSLAGRLFQSRAMCFFGKYSYGIYVFHGIIAYALQENGTLDVLAAKLGSHTLAMIVQASAGVGVSCLVAVASYGLYERHFLRLKDRFAPGSASLDARHVPQTSSPA